MRALLPIVFAALFMGCHDTRSFTVSVDREELQERIDRQFPVTRTAVLTRVTLGDPQVILSEGSERLGVALQMAGRLPLVGEVGGNVSVSGVLSYRPETQQFLLHEPRVDSLALDRVNTRIVETLRQAVEAAATLALADVPLYTLERRTLRETAAQHVLRSVRVRDGKLELELGLP